MATNYKILGQGVNLLKIDAPENGSTIVSELKIKNTSYPTNVDLMCLDESFGINLRNKNSSDNFYDEIYYIASHSGHQSFLNKSELVAMEVAQKANSIVKLLPNGALDSTTTYPEIDGYVSDFAIQSDGKIVIVGDFETVGGVTRNYIARLNADGSLDTSFDPNANYSVFGVIIQNDGKILIRGAFTSINGTSSKYFTRLNSDGTLDTSYNSNKYNPNNTVSSFALQSDGKLVIVGRFSSYIRRINSDGTTDTSFSPSVNSVINDVFIDIFGNIFIGGFFTLVNGVYREIVAKLESDGSLDTSFLFVNNDNWSRVNTIFVTHNFVIFISGSNDEFLALNGSGSVNTNISIELDRAPTSISQLDDDRIYIGGNFTQVNGEARYSVAIVNFSEGGVLDNSFEAGSSGFTSKLEQLSDGSFLMAGNIDYALGQHKTSLALFDKNKNIDTSFSVRANDSINDVKVQSDNKIIIAGRFTKVNGVDCGGIVRLNSDGTLDNSFNIPSFVWGEFPGNIYSVEQQTDGKIIAVGYFYTVDGVTRNYIARLNSDGSLDTSFNASVNFAVVETARQSDGKILIGGQFTTIYGVTRNYIARLNADGSLDTSFESEPNNDVWHIVPQPDGKILIGGNFQLVQSVPNRYMARLNNDGSLDTSFSAKLSDPALSKILVQPDGKILIVGSIYAVNDTPFNQFGRLNSDGSIDTSFEVAESISYRNIFLDDEYNIVAISNASFGLSEPSITTFYTYISSENNEYIIKNKAIEYDEEIKISGGIALEPGQSLIIETGQYNPDTVIIQAYGIEETV